ncbi:ROK family protein [Georgenia sp. EYE_87]|uniref:ROK family protein n=1 Tax=Georgenia sp. EYE_87 TaxID=2853448 RepID=UPI002003259C|nr:ROK family protein [Georgenia sp. EYE_87]MCK6210556.1 ROK family protein [Georgenia sp. EYE_87]
MLIGVDIGGTKTAAAWVSQEGRVGPVVSTPTPAADGPNAVLETVVSLVQSLLGDPSDREEGRKRHAVALGVGTAGLVDVTTGVVVGANDTFPGWVGTPVGEVLANRLRLPVHVENDVDAHAAGEAWVGAAAGASSALVVAVGTGVGCSLVLGGKPLRGAHSGAGEIGHMPCALAAGLMCPCGRPGHLEALASGPAVHREYLRRGGNPESQDAPSVLAQMRNGDAIASGVVRDAAVALGQAVAGLITALDPQIVVVGGGFALADETWWGWLEEELRRQLIAPLATVPIRRSELGGAAPIVGAAAGARRLVNGGQG